MSNPTPGYDPTSEQGAQPGWGAPQPPGYPSSGYSPAPSYSGGAGPSTMGPADAVRSVLTQYAVFTGRARRSEFWWFFLANFIAGIVATIIDAGIGYPVFQIVVTLGLLIPGLAVGARRLHDTGRSGWWQLLALVPLIGIIVLIVFWATEGDQAPNQHGPSPKYQPAGGYTGY